MIGGYAVNAYVPPRFSIDCDLFVLKGMDKVKKILLKKGFEERAKGDVPYGEYYRFTRKSDKVSFDLLFNSVLDRETGISFEASLFEKHSRKRFTVGRANPIRIELRIADPELLFVMKFVSARRQDVRDIFMLSGIDLKWDLVKEIIDKKCTEKLVEKRIKSIKEKLTNTDYRDNLQGAFGKIPDKIFDSCMTKLKNFLDKLQN